MENNDFQTCLKDVWETTSLHFKYLHLGYFFNHLSRMVNLSRIAKNIDVITEAGSSYKLNGQLISNVLNEIYSKPGELTFYANLTLVNSVRGIVMAMFEGIKNSDFKNTVIQDVLKNDKVWYKNFEGVIKFIRNQLSHNIRDKIQLVHEHYQKQEKWWRDYGKPYKNKIEFSYDYSLEDSAISMPNYKTKLSINIDWDKISTETLYADVVYTFENFMIAEFCYNAVKLIHEKHR